VAARVGETAVRGSLLFAWQFPTVIHGRVRPEILRYYFSFAKLPTPKSWVETFGANLVYRLTYSGDVVAFKMGRRQGARRAHI
jgi:hypothetical protein